MGDRDGGELAQEGAGIGRRPSAIDMDMRPPS
jgi:hypothetical protein